MDSALSNARLTVNQNAVQHTTNIINVWWKKVVIKMDAFVILNWDFASVRANVSKWPNAKASAEKAKYSQNALASANRHAARQTEVTIIAWRAKYVFPVASATEWMDIVFLMENVYPKTNVR
jgi:hypothetical protein